MRQAFTVPLCYFPSLVLFLDNGHDFLLNVLLQLSEHVAYRWFDAPIEALNSLESYRRRHTIFLRHCLSEYRDAQESFRFEMDKSLCALYAELYNPYRFSELSVMVIDSKPRGMDGFEFCRRVGHTCIKKLLLIQADEEPKAQEAIRAGIIDAYLDKKSPDIAQKIHRVIAELQMRYFLSMSEVISHCLGAAFSCSLQDKRFQFFMESFVSRQSIVEYYLIDREGSFLLLDEDANPSILMMCSAKQIEKNALFAAMNGASEALVEAIAQGQKVPCPFYLDSERTNVLSAFEESLVPSVKIDIEGGAAVTYLPTHLLSGLRDRKILSYHRYLNELDAEELSLYIKEPE